jgi:hypothetical protein
MNDINRMFLNLMVLSNIFFSFAQEKHHTNSRNYVSYSEYKERYAQIDSIGFMIKNQDTLIRVKAFLKPEGNPVPYEIKDSLFLEKYKSVVFRPLANNTEKTKPMKYWKGGIKIFFTKSVSRKVRRKFMAFVKDIDKELDSLHISRELSKEKANFIIYHDTDFEYDSNLENNESSNYWVYWNKQNQINKGFIRISKQLIFSDELEIIKIKELFVQSLGWFIMNPKEFDCNSYFSGCKHDNEKITAMDIQVLKYHYSYGICKGTDKALFEKQHEKAQEILKKYDSKVMFYH